MTVLDFLGLGDSGQVVGQTFADDDWEPFPSNDIAFQQGEGTVTSSSEPVKEAEPLKPVSYYVTGSVFGGELHRVHPVLDEEGDFLITLPAVFDTKVKPEIEAKARASLFFQLPAVTQASLVMAFGDSTEKKRLSLGLGKQVKAEINGSRFYLDKTFVTDLPFSSEWKVLFIW